MKTENKNFKRINTWHSFSNNKGEKITVNIGSTICNPNDKNCLPNLWVKNGYMKKPIYNYLTATVYVRLPEPDGRCISKYNPTSKNGSKINFDWLLETSETNVKKILREIKRLANK